MTTTHRQPAPARATAHARRRGRGATAAVVGAVLGMTAVSASALTSPATVPPLPVDTSQALGDQPQVPVGHCAFSPLGGTEIRKIFSQWSTSNPSPTLSTGDTVDPFDPCHIVQVLDQQRVVRSDDNGRRFSTIFAAPSQSVPPVFPVIRDPHTLVTMTAAPVVTPAPGQEYVIDTSGPYGVVHSGDGGVHWEQRNLGLPLAPKPPVGLYGSATLRTIAFTPSRPQVGYVVVALAGGSYTLLFQTGDGGVSWSAVATTVTTITSVAIDPGDDGHVFVIDQSSNAVWESSDAGGSWSEHSLPSQLTASSAADALLVTHPLGHGAGKIRLYVRSQGGSSIIWLRSFDDGTTWREIAVPLSSEDQALAADPLDPDQMIIAAPGTASDGGPSPLTLYASGDGFATVRVSRPVWARLTRWQVQPPYIYFYDRVRLTADHAHDFFLEVVADNGQNRGGGGNGLVGDNLLAFRSSAVAVLSPPPPPPSTLQTNPPLPVLYSAPVLGSCGLSPLSPVLRPIEPIVPETYYSHTTSAGTLTYDGHYLDYTQDPSFDSPGSEAVMPTGLIYRIDPVTCQAAPPLQTQMPPDPTDNGAPPLIQQLTYDSRYVFTSGHQGAILVLATWYRDDRGGDLPFPVYAVDPLSGATELALLLPPGYIPWGCCLVFSYDVSSDDLWVAVDGPIPVRMPTLRGDVAVPIYSCMGASSMNRDNPATMLAVANGGMYVQLEDDTTILRMDDRSCTIEGGFKHAKFEEPPDENEQLACDPITFGDASAHAAAGNPPTTLLWVRDSVGNSVTAYGIRDLCPFPTVLTLQPAQPVLVGTVVSLCAVLQRQTADRIPMPGETVSFRVDGQAVGSAPTDASGRACLRATAPAIAGAHLVHAHFAGTPISFLPSSADGLLFTFALGTGTHAGPVVPSLFAGTLPPPTPLQPLSQAPAAEQAQVEAQAQAQAQAQTQSTTQTVTQMQPGIMVQRQRQVQVTMQTARWRSASPAYNASRLREDRFAGSSVAMSAACFLSLSLLVGRPAVAVARRRARRRRT